MKFHLYGSKQQAAASRLAGFGMEFGEDGIPVSVSFNAETMSAKIEGGVLVLELQRPSQLFFALKFVSDRGAGEGFSHTFRPKFKNLTFMLDCSRNAVAKPETVEKLLGLLAVMGYDSLGLYMEDTFPIPEYPYFGYLRGGYTREEIAQMEETAELFGIELVPYVQTLAHFNTLTRYPAMQSLFDTDDILLVGEEETYAFLDALLSSVSTLFKTRSVNIGMDEAYMLGRGRYLDRHGNRSRYDIMAEHLGRVVEICNKYGLKPMMWSDMFFSIAMQSQYGSELPEDVAQKVPPEVELIYWDYSGLTEEHYRDRIGRHRVFRNPIGFAGGAWKWLGYAPDNRFSLAASEAAINACIAEGIERFIVTGWGDNGGECSPFAALPTLDYCSRAAYGEEFDGAAFERLAGMPRETFLTLDLANRVIDRDNAEDKTSAGKYLLFNDPLLGVLDTTLDEGLGALYLRHAAALLRAKRSAGEWEYLFETQYRLCRVLSVKADLGVRLRKAYRAGDREALLKLLNEMRRLPSDIEAFLKAFRAQWKKENHVQGLEVQDLRLGALKQRVAAAIETVDAYLSGQISSIPELEEELLCFLGHGKEWEKDYDQCEWRWRRMTSTGVNE